VIKIEVVANVVHTRTVTPKAPSTKAPFQVREQDAYAYMVDRNGQVERHPQKIRLDLDRDQPPYEPGFYTLNPQSIYVGKWGTLELGRLHLKAIKQAELKAA